MSAAGIGAQAAVVAALKRLGFEEVRQKGSHLVLRRTMLNADGSAAAVICVVPLHRRHLHPGPLTKPPRHKNPLLPSYRVNGLSNKTCPCLNLISSD